ncbi:hypothetical protein E4U53_007147 [Claviceps sorghi]|nr:hypothetical protein E4U53_007147 [Claviceps sorghi]
MAVGLENNPVFGRGILFQVIRGGVTGRREEAQMDVRRHRYMWECIFFGFSGGIGCIQALSSVYSFRVMKFPAVMIDGLRRIDRNAGYF